MVTARIAGLSPGTSPPPVTIPITPFLALMRPPSCFPFLRYIRRSARYHYTRHRDFADAFCFGEPPKPTPNTGAAAQPLLRILSRDSASSSESEYGKSISIGEVRKVYHVKVSTCHRVQHGRAPCAGRRSTAARTPAARR